ncbi:MAG: DUF5685 family protein [Eubacteriales bacterium]|nr:DUF5685 family protein [Eubacteriales bacterium]
MFGYIICNRHKLTEDEWRRYQSVYCGLCHSLKKRYGSVERLGLNYDMTFLALYLEAMYEEPQEHYETRCLLHPCSPKSIACSKYIDYAADMTVLMAYYNSLDDWQDERKCIKGLYSKLLQKDIEGLRETYPRQCAGVLNSIQRLQNHEKSPDATPDHLMQDAGEMLQELFVYQEDFWSDKHRRFGYELGRFIYLMDATMDYDKDRKKQNYNPLVNMDKKPEEMEELLAMTMGNASAIFEKLPILQDVNILRNILYGGVWLPFYAKFTGKDKRNDQ